MKSINIKQQKQQNKGGENLVSGNADNVQRRLNVVMLLNFHKKKKYGGRAEQFSTLK